MATEPKTRGRLLLVDDEALVLSSLNRLFRSDYDVTTAGSGDEALSLLKKQSFDVIISDQRMPGMKGVELLRQAKEIAPQSMRILLTGYSDLSAIIDSVNEGEVFRYITKPWKNEALKYTVALAANAAKTSATDVMRAAGHGLVIEVQHDEAANDHSRTQPVDLSAACATSPDNAAPVDVLLIDNDERFIDIVREACGAGRAVHFASTTQDALNVLEKHDTIGVIISEVRIGQSDVTQLLSLLKRYHPSVVTVVASGYSDANVVIKLVNEGQIFRFLGKPAKQDRIRDVIGRAGKLHRSISQYSSLADRHVVDDGGLEHGDLAVAGPSPAAGSAAGVGSVGAASASAPNAQNSLISRIARLFRHR